LAKQELLVLEKKKSETSADAELARKLQEQEKQEALRIKQQREQQKVGGKPSSSSAAPAPPPGAPPPSAFGPPPGVKLVKPPKECTLPPGCVLGSDGTVYDQSNGFKIVGALKKKK